MRQRIPAPAPSQLAIWVQVTDHHIDIGCPNDCRSCAAAMAVAEALQLRPRPEGPLHVWVDEVIVCVPAVAVWATPPTLRAFLPAFDEWRNRNGRRPRPIGFWLPEPDLPGGYAWEEAVKRSLMPPQVDEDPVSRLAWMAAGSEAGQ